MGGHAQLGQHHLGVLAAAVHAARDPPAPPGHRIAVSLDIDTPHVVPQRHDPAASPLPSVLHRWEMPILGRIAYSHFRTSLVVERLGP
jgi:hypothetical protein